MKKCIFMNLKKKWINHLKENNMTYIEHMIFALFHGMLCVLAGIYLIIHSILPILFTTAGSNLVIKLSKYFDKSN
jgi:hypothetical protein